MGYRFDTEKYRRIFLLCAPVCFIFWLGFIKFIYSIPQITDAEILRSTIFFTLLFLPGGPILAFYGIDLDYEIEIRRDNIAYRKRGLIGKADLVLPFSHIESVSETALGSLVIRTKDKRQVKIVKYLSIDFEELDHKCKAVFDAIEVNSPHKVISFIKLLLIEKIGETESFRVNAKESKAFAILKMDSSSS